MIRFRGFTGKSPIYGRWTKMFPIVGVLRKGSIILFFIFYFLTLRGVTLALLVSDLGDAIVGLQLGKSYLWKKVKCRLRTPSFYQPPHLIWYCILLPFSYPHITLSKLTHLKHTWKKVDHEPSLLQLLLPSLLQLLSCECTEIISQASFLHWFSFTCL